MNNNTHEAYSVMYSPCSVTKSFVIGFVCVDPIEMIL